MLLHRIQLQLHYRQLLLHRIQLLLHLRQVVLHHRQLLWHHMQLLLHHIQLHLHHRQLLLYHSCCFIVDSCGCITDFQLVCSLSRQRSLTFSTSTISACQDRRGEDDAAGSLQRPRGPGKSVGALGLHQVRDQASGQGRKFVERTVDLFRRRTKSGGAQGPEEGAGAGRTRPRRLDQ
jgi:hypothetical protein